MHRYLKISTLFYSRNLSRKTKLGVALFIIIFLASDIWTVNYPGIIPRPNVVLIIIDTLRADKLGCYGFPDETSPEIDRFAENGILFKRTIAQSSWTKPSIGSMLTSLYPRSIGIYKEKFDILDDKYLTLAEVLKENGYFTLGVTANPNINSIFNFNQGFDHYIDSDIIWDWMKQEEGNELYSANILPDSRIVFDKALNLAKTVSNRSV